VRVLVNSVVGLMHRLCCVIGGAVCRSNCVKRVSLLGYHLF